jgi:CRISPR-associated endonuclease/helicase Cas3
LQQVVRVPIDHAPDKMAVSVLKEYGLQHCFYLGKVEHEESILRVALVDEAGCLELPDGSPRASAKRTLKYRQDIGYMAEKAD